MRRAVFSMSVLLVMLAFGAGAAGSSAGGARSTASLDLYTGVVSSETLGRIVRQGYDIADARQAAGGVRVDLVLTQELCDVCAVSYAEVQKAARVLDVGTRVVSLEPTTPEEVFGTIELVGRLTDRITPATELVASAGRKDREWL